MTISQAIFRDLLLLSLDHATCARNSAAAVDSGHSGGIWMRTQALLAESRLRRCSSRFCFEIVSSTYPDHRAAGRSWVVHNPCCHLQWRLSMSKYRLLIRLGNKRAHPKCSAKLSGFALEFLGKRLVVCLHYYATIN